MKRLLTSIVLVSAFTLFAGCASEMGSDAETDECGVLAKSISDCGGSVPDDFEQECAENPEGADKIAAAFCSSELDDGVFGWVGLNERCFNFNFECEGDLVCRPLNSTEQDQTCRDKGGYDGLCDDDNDCVEGRLCVGEEVATYRSAGRCR